MKEFTLPSGSRDVVARVLAGLRACMKLGVEYTGERASTLLPALHAIKNDSVEAEIIAESMFFFSQLCSRKSCKSRVSVRPPTNSLTTLRKNKRTLPFF